jgi:hypothetical protein
VLAELMHTLPLADTQQLHDGLVEQAEGDPTVLTMAWHGLGVRAVEANPTRVYGKLGIRSRAELAARFRG